MSKKVNDESFEEKMEELEALILEIESGKNGLNSSVEKYAKAQDIAGQLEEILKGAKESVDSSELEEKESDNEEEE